MGKFIVHWNTETRSGTRSVRAEHEEDAIERTQDYIMHKYGEEIQQHRIESEEHELDDYWYPDGE